MKKPMKKKTTNTALQQSPPQTVIQNCTFTNQPAAGETVSTIARALEANALALNALANQLIAHGPMLQIGKID